MISAPLLEQQIEIVQPLRSAPDSSSARVFSIDVLRGLAILLVMGVHVPAYPIWSTAGWVGVDLFFVLSGFLISNLLFVEYRKQGDIRLARFFLRRALKLYPSFWFLMAVTVGYCVISKTPFTWQQLVGELTLTQNYVGAIWGHTWSLAVEEHFYLLLPLTLAWMMRRNPGASDPFRSIPWLFGAIFAACLGLRLWTATAFPFDHKLHFQPSHLRFDALFSGVFLSYLHNFRQPVVRRVMDSVWRLPLSALGVAALTPALFLEYNDQLIYTFGFASVSFGCGMMLLCSVYPERGRKQPVKPGAVSRGIAAMGRYSYTIYLWHVPLAMVFMWTASRLPGVNPFALHAVYFAACIAVGVASSKLIEIPGLRLRERLTNPAPRLP